MKHVMKRAAVIVFLAVIGIAPIAFAHGGYGDGDDGYGGYMMGPGYGGHMMGPGYGGHMRGYGYGGHMRDWDGHMGWWGDRDDRDDRSLSREQAERLDGAREQFYKDSRDLQDRIYAKSAEMREELSKQTPDRSRLNDLQNQLSELQSQYDRKRLDYQLEVRKIVPETEGRYADSYGYGPGGCWR